MKRERGAAGWLQPAGGTQQPVLEMCWNKDGGSPRCGTPDSQSQVGISSLATHQTSVAAEANKHPVGSRRLSERLGGRWLEVLRALPGVWKLMRLISTGSVGWCGVMSALLSRHFVRGSDSFLLRLQRATRRRRDARGLGEGGGGERRTAQQTNKKYRFGVGQTLTWKQKKRAENAATEVH